MSISKASTSTILNGLIKSKYLKTRPSLPSIPGLTMWYDASDLSSLTLSGSNVVQWNDKSGNGRHAAQSGSMKPQYITNALNGMGAVDFGTSSQYVLTISNAPTFHNKTAHFFAVVKTRQENATDYSGIIGAYNPSGATAGALAWCFPGNSGAGGTQQWLNPQRAWGTQGIKNDYSSSIFYNVNASLNNGSCAYRVSRSDDGTGSLSGIIDNNTNAIGWQEGNTYGGNVTIAELICFGYTLSTTDRNNVENYLYDKWGV